jgi:hypothetical protein
MKASTLKTKAISKAKAIVFGILTVIGIIIYLLRYDSVPLSLFLFTILPIFIAILLALLPFILTVVFIRLIVIINKDQSNVDHLTYIDQGMFNDFNWDHDPVNRLIGQVERKVIEIREDSDDVARGLIHQEYVAPKYSLSDIDDIPDYDPEGPSPFKKLEN